MNIKPLGTPQVIMSNAMSKHNYFAWPTVTRLQDGRIAVAASGFRLGHVCPFGKTVISYSSNEGETYTPPTPIIDTVLDDRDGGITTFGENSFVVTSFNNRAATQRRYAEDFRLSETQTHFAPFPDVAYRLGYLDAVTAEDEDTYCGSTMRITHDGGVTFGPLLKSPVSAPHGPILLADGSLLYVGSHFFPEEDVPFENNYVEAWKVSSEGNMEYVGRIDHIYAPDGELLASWEPHAIQLPDGRILCHIRVEKTTGGPDVFTLYQSISADGGRTWSQPVPVIGPQDGAPAHLYRHSSGVLISVYGNRVIGTPGIKAMLSTDDGASWETNHLICECEHSGDMGYPSTVELADGSLLTVFYAYEKSGGPAVIMQQRWELIR